MDIDSEALSAGEIDIKAIIREAFLLGFTVSREGYNGDCAFGHLAPSRLKPEGGESFDGFRDRTRSKVEFLKLQEEAVALMARERGF